MLLPRVITAVIGLGVILPAIHYGGFFYMALVGCIVALCLYEYGLALTAGQKPVSRFSLVFFGLLMAVAAVLGRTHLEGLDMPDNLYPLAMSVIIFGILFVEILTPNRSWDRVCNTFTGVFLIPWSLAHLINIRDIAQYGEYLTYFMFITVWVSDTGAYFTGRFLGRHKLNQEVSPKKTWEGAIGGMILTASHNPRQWNALKLLDANGEFLSAAQGEEVLRLAEVGDFDYAGVDEMGHYRQDNTYNRKHIDRILALPLVDVEAIRKAHFRVALDTVNSVGGVVLPQLLRELGVESVTTLNGNPTGDFSHNPEPLERNLGDIMALMRGGGYDLAFVVDPDVDRLAMICEDGRMFGEEYTLVAVADYVLRHTPGATVSNLSSTRALRDVTKGYGQSYYAAAVGEVNVVNRMKQVGAVIGGEGNGGVIYPACHYGRDALVGIALFLSHLAHEGKTMTALRAGYPAYFMAKERIDLVPGTDVDAILARIKDLYHNEEVTDIDGVKIDFPDRWVHLRKSNTEPIIRIYSEAPTAGAADELARRIMDTVRSLI